MASKKNKNKNKKRNNSQSETKLAASAAIPYQTFRELSSPDGISLLKKIAIHVDNTQKETILWKDIQQVFPNVLCIKNEDTDVPFVKNGDFENLLPLRIVCLPDVVLNVVSKDSEIKELVDIPMPALELLSLEIEIDPVQKPARHDPRGRDRDTLTSAQRLQHEMDAMKTLMRHSPPLGRIDSLSGAPLKALTTLAYSDDMRFQKTAACRFAAEIEKGHDFVKREVIEPILYLLRSNDVAVLEPGLFALAKLVHQDEKNSKLAVELGALEDLNSLMRADAPNIHGIALAVIREVIENESLRVEVARSGIIGPLFLLASSNDPRVSRNVAATFCEFSQTNETRRMIVEAGAIPVLIRFLDFNPDVQTVAVRALADISIDRSYRRMIADEQEGLISTLVDLLDSHNPDIPPAAALALSRMTFDQDFKAEILQTRVLTLLSQMMRSNSYQFIRNSVRLFLALYKDLAIGTTHIEAAITDRIVELISYKGNSDIQYDAIFSLYGLSNNDQNAREVVRAGAVDRICALVSQANLRLQSQMTSFLCHLTSFESLGPQLGRSGLFEVLIPLSLSTHEKVWTASAGAILQIIDTKDHPTIARVWNNPKGGLRNCFIRSLRSSYGSLQHLTICTIFKWLEGENFAMKNLITGSPEILTRVKEMANDAEACAPIPVQDLRDNVDLDPSVITMVQAGLIVDMLELKTMEE